MLKEASCIVVKCCNKSNCNSYIPANVKFVPSIGRNSYQYINREKDHNLKNVPGLNEGTKTESHSILGVTEIYTVGS
jgi:hypothetical protein